MTDATQAQTPTFATVIENTIHNRLVLLNGGFLGKITAWDNSTGKATVEAFFQLKPSPTVDEPNPDPEDVIVENVRVLFPSVGGWTLKASSIVGEIVWCQGCSRSLEAIEAWKTSGDAYVPSPPRIMALDDLVGFPVSWGSGSTDDLTLEGHGVAIALTTGGEVRLGDIAASYAVALASKVKTELDLFKAAYNVHIHPIAVTGVTPGGGAGTGVASVTVSQAGLTGDMGSPDVKATG